MLAVTDAGGLSRSGSAATRAARRISRASTRPFSSERSQKGVRARRAARTASASPEHSTALSRSSKAGSDTSGSSLLVITRWCVGEKVTGFPRMGLPVMGVPPVSAFSRSVATWPLRGPSSMKANRAPFSANSTLPWCSPDDNRRVSATTP